MKGNPDVSVIMPVFNAERFLREAVESILCQTHQALELIAIDDGSTDSSCRLLFDFACRDPRVVAKTSPHTGIVGALGEAVARARSDYLVRMTGA